MPAYSFCRQIYEVQITVARLACSIEPRDAHIHVAGKFTCVSGMYRCFTTGPGITKVSSHTGCIHRKLPILGHRPQANVPRESSAAGHATLQCAVRWATTDLEPVIAHISDVIARMRHRIAVSITGCTVMLQVTSQSCIGQHVHVVPRYRVGIVHVPRNAALSETGIFQIPVRACAL